jgi:hypothetical protein
VQLLQLRQAGHHCRHVSKAAERAAVADV